MIFTATDGMPIHSQLFMPKDLKAGERRPALIFFHGGSRRQMLLNWHYNYYYRNAYAMNQWLASQGYIVLSVNYRSGIGYGLEFREALNYGASGGAEFNDVMGAGLYMKNRADVDPARIGLWGGSYGGYLTAMGLSRASDLFAAGVDFHGVHDWNQGIRTFVPDYNVLDDPDFSRRAFAASPMASVDTLEVAGAVDPWRRRPQRVVHRVDQPDHGAAQAERRSRAAGVPGRSARLPPPPELGARLQGDGGVLQPPVQEQAGDRNAAQLAQPTHRRVYTPRLIRSTQEGR